MAECGRESVTGGSLAADWRAALALSDLTGREILLATEEYDRIGRDAFLDTYGFAPAKSYLRCRPSSSTGGGPKPGPMRTLSHSRPFALCAVEAVTWAASSEHSRRTASMIVSGPCASASRTKALRS